MLKKIIKQRYFVLLMLIASILLPMSASAVIYQYRDNEGRIYFSDEAVQGNYKLLRRYSVKGGLKPIKPGKIDIKQWQKNQRRYSPLIESVAKETLLRPELLHAVVKAESAYDPGAESSKGAVGLMQLMPATAKRYGVTDRYNPEQNLRGGANYLKDLLVQFDFNLKLAIAAYNAGENAVIRSGNQVPDFPETQQYVEKVMRFYRENREDKS